MWWICEQLTSDGLPNNTHNWTAFLDDGRVERMDGRAPAGRAGDRQNTQNSRFHTVLLSLNNIRLQVITAIYYISTSHNRHESNPVS